MRNRKRSLIVASLLSALLLTASAFNVVHAAGGPNVPIPCQDTTWKLWGSGWWSNTLSPTNYDQKLTVQLYVLRDYYNTNTYCNEMQSIAVLQYRNVSDPGSVIATIVQTDTFPSTGQSDRVYQGPAGGNWQVATANSQPYSITSCGYAFGQWTNPAVNPSVRVPAQGSHCE